MSEDTKSSTEEFFNANEMEKRMQRLKKVRADQLRPYSGWRCIISAGFQPSLWAVIVTVSGLLFGQSNVGGGGIDPDERQRGERMITQGDRMIAQNDMANRLSRVAIFVAGLALLVSLIALFRR